MDVMTAKKIIVRDSLFDPTGKDQSTVKYNKSKGSKPRFRVWIYLDGKDTYYVDYVIYRLHSTFQNPIRKVERSLSNPNCSLIIWTWGIFELVVEIVLKNGDKISATHPMTYGEQLKRTDLQFIEEDPITPWNFT
jgi:transcription initiation factor IIF auxiliary subunit